MSEAAAVKPEHDQPQVESEMHGQPSAKGGSALAVLALLVALVGAGAGGFSVWQLQQQRDVEQTQNHAFEASLQAESAQLQKLGAQVQAQLASLPNSAELAQREAQLQSVQAEQQRLDQQLKDLSEGTGQDWRLVEAEQLLRLASLRLATAQDVDSAQALVSAADDILREQKDPAAFAAREQLNRSLEALRTTPNPDRAGLFLQLAALREQAAQLTPLAPTLQGQGDVLTDIAEQSSDQAWWATWLHSAGKYFRIEFDADRNVRPLLSGQSLAQVRLSLSLALEQAQWAALHGSQSVYQQALKQAAEILDGHFNLDNPESRSLHQRLGELEKQSVTVTVPDLSPAFEALQSYLKRKQGLAAEPVSAEGDQ